MTKLSNLRIGNPTSSEIYRLCTNGTRPMTEYELALYKEENPKGRRTTIDDFGAPFYSYLEECKAERFFKQNLENEKEVLAFSWGKLCELHVHNILPNSYIMQSEESLQHKLIPEWVGTPDGTKLSKSTISTVSETKCPLNKKSFYQLIKYLYNDDGFQISKKKEINGNDIIKLIRENHKDGEKWYWQIISNACILKSINGLDNISAELIVFLPYIDELEEIKAFNSTLDEPYSQIQWAKDGELPFLYRETGIQNLNIIPFDIPKEDEEFLTSRVQSFVELLNKN